MEGGDLSPVAFGECFTDAEDNFVFLPTARNTERAALAAIPELQDVPEEANHWTNAVWKRKKVRVFKYVDDGITTDKIDMENADTGVAVDETIGPDGEPVRHVTQLRLKRAIASENAFKSTSSNATRKLSLIHI